MGVKIHLSSPVRRISLVLHQASAATNLAYGVASLRAPTRVDFSSASGVGGDRKVCKVHPYTNRPIVSRNAANAEIMGGYSRHEGHACPLKPASGLRPRAIPRSSAATTAVCAPGALEIWLNWPRILLN